MIDGLTESRLMVLPKFVDAIAKEESTNTEIIHNIVFNLDRSLYLSLLTTDVATNYSRKIGLSIIEENRYQQYYKETVFTEEQESVIIDYLHEIMKKDDKELDIPVFDNTLRTSFIIRNMAKKIAANTFVKHDSIGILFDASIDNSTAFFIKDIISNISKVCHLCEGRNLTKLFTELQKLKPEAIYIISDRGLDEIVALPKKVNCYIYQVDPLIEPKLLQKFLLKLAIENDPEKTARAIIKDLARKMKFDINSNINLF